MLNLQPRFHSPGLTRGLIVHEGIAAFYKSKDAFGIWCQETPAKVRAHLAAVPSDLQTKHEDEISNALDCVLRYAEWAPKNDDFVMKETNLKLVLAINEIPFQMEADGIARREDNTFWLHEIKTATQPMNETIVEMDPQLTTYLWLLDEAGYNMTGIIYTQIPTKILKSGPYAGQEVIRYYLHRTPEQIQAFYLETVRQVFDMLIIETPDGKEGPRIYRSPDRECTWGCQYYGLCRIESQGGDAEEYKKQIYVERELDR